MKKNFRLEDDFVDDLPPSARRQARKTAATSPKAGSSARIKRLSRQASPAERPPEQTLEETNGFNPTFSGSRFEREWILNYLGPFYDNQQIVDVLHRVRGGKEANVYCCSAYPGSGLAVVAAKVYRPRKFRIIRNDALYRQNRELIDVDGKRVKNDRELHAVVKGTQYGRRLEQVSWQEHEYLTLQILHDAGANVPQPVASGLNAILMEYWGEPFSPAPTLSEVDLTAAESAQIFERLIDNVRIFLRCHRVHSDLSAYNVLYWEGDFRVIDFPQAVDPRRNPEAWTFFARDVTRLCDYFSAHGVKTGPPRDLARRLWEEYEHAPKIALEQELQKAILLEEE